MKQKLIFPSFINYFRPYFDPSNKNKSMSRVQIDKKY